MSRRDTILDALVALLGAGGKPSGLTVDRHRTAPTDSSQLPWQGVYAVDEENTTGPARGIDNKRLARRKLRVCVESRCSYTSATTADQAIDPYLTWSVKQVCAGQQLIAGMHDIQELGTVWDQIEHSDLLAGARQMFLVDYVTSASDPDAVS